MPDNIINDAPEILAPGLGLNGVKEFDIKKLKEMVGFKSFQTMPDNINAEPEILAPGLGLNVQ